MSGLIIVLILLLIYIAYSRISNKIKRVSRDLLGTEDIVKGLRKVEEESKSTPISVSGGNKLFLPKIQEDFPDFHQETMEEKIKQFVIIYLNCLERQDFSNLNNIETTEVVKDELKSKVLDLIDNKERLKYDNIKIHAITVSGYMKTKEFATVKYQISLEYLGNKGKTQVKYEIDLTYLFKNLDKESFTVRCNHCGASLNETSTVCEYCGTIVVRNIIKVWRVSNIQELRKVG